MLLQQIKEQQRRRLSLAARELLGDYQVDQDLTAFSNLDGEEFHA